MAEEKPTIHVDTDWKKQAQEEKRRLAEQEEKAKAAGATTAPPAGAPAPGGSAAAATAGPGRRELPAASFATLVNSTVTQVLVYLGDLAPRGNQPMVDLDMAKHYIDTLAVLEEKTAGNLTPEEKQMLDGALYEVRMRYVSVASQFT